MASSHINENATQCKTCRCGEGDKNIWTTRTSESSDKQLQKCSNCQIFKSGPLFLSSKGIGWTSWKKRWFVLTRTSLVFYRSDPNGVPQKGSEANPTLGGIDLNNSGSVVVRADKKLLTVLFPDGRDGRAFTLKAETSEELNEWKTALENSLAQAPSAALVMGQNGIFRNEIADSIEASFEQWRDRRPVKSLVVGRPILLALEDIDGSPSFLEKALRFIEEYGIKVEGILRQSADVEEVERRVQEYEQGKNEFFSDEDAHVIGDCIKHVLRELPSSPVPASCCTALVEAYRTDRGGRINAMRAAISDTFPEPNLRLVQRILKMMRTVASHKSENRMSLSALAACMAPLLLRSLLAGDCELENDFNIGGDGSIQLLKAAAAANHAQAIVVILLEEYEFFFDEELLEDGSLSSDIYTESEDDDAEDDESTDNDILEDDGYHDAQNDVEADIEDDPECSSSGTLSERSSDAGSDLSQNKATEDHSTDSGSPQDHEAIETTRTSSITSHTTTLKQDITQKPSTTHIQFTQDAGLQTNDLLQNENSNSLVAPSYEAHESTGDVTSTSPMKKSVSHILPSSIAIFSDKSNEPMPRSKQPTVWGRTSARKNLSLESIDYSSEDEIAIQRLENTKSGLQTKITKEVKGNAILQESLERRKEALHERRLALEKDVERLREQLQKERDLRASLESGLMNMRPGHLSITSAMDSKTRADLEEITLAEADVINLKHKVADLRGQLSHHLQHSSASLCESCSQHIYKRLQRTEKNQQEDVDSTSSVHQNANSLKSDVVLSGVACENVQEKTQDLPSSPNRETSEKKTPEPTSQNISSENSGSSTVGPSILPNKFSAKDENALFRADCEDVKIQTQDSQSLPNKGSSSISNTVEPTTVVSGAASINSTSKGEDSVSGADHENAKALSRDLISPADMQTSLKLLPGEEQTAVVSDATSKKSTSSGMNPKFGTDTENVKAHSQHSLPSADSLPSQKLLPNTANLGSKKSLGSNNLSSTVEATAFGRNTASKKSSARGEKVKKETQDSPFLPSRQPSQKQQPGISNLNTVKPSGSSEETTVARNAASKKSSRAEETATTSSALTRLTNRLNFLKERRVQLVNELQNLDTTRTSGAEGPPRTNSR